MDSVTVRPRPGLASFFGSIGRPVAGIGPMVVEFFGQTGAVWSLFRSTLYFSFVAPLRGRSKLRKQLMPIMSSVGARSLPIVSIISLLIGSVLVLQTGTVMEQYGQIQEVPGLVALAMTRELGPLMTSMVLIGRVGASYTAVIGSMSINEELTALRSMAIHPIGYLVAPRFLSLLIMMPCLVMFSFLLGMMGGAVVALGLYGIPVSMYLAKTVQYLGMADIIGGLLKAGVFAVLISITCCHFGLTTKGGPTGLGRYIMVAVVTCLVVVVLADAVLTAFLVNYLL